jgi:hypothetical protein
LLVVISQAGDGLMGPCRMNKLLVPHFRDPDEIVETKGEVKAEYKPAAPSAGVSVPEVISESEEDDEDF